MYFPSNKVVVVAAVARHTLAIGLDNKLPWRIPAELTHFKETTYDCPVIMGRKTFESIGKPLKDRTTIVLSSSIDPAYKASLMAMGVLLAASMDEAMLIADNVATQRQSRHIVVAGGASIYKQAYNYASELIISCVNYEGKADAYFPAWNHFEWTPDKEEENAEFDVITFKRITPIKKRYNNLSSLPSKDERYLLFYQHAGALNLNDPLYIVGPLSFNESEDAHQGTGMCLVGWLPYDLTPLEQLCD